MFVKKQFVKKMFVKKTILSKILGQKNLFLVETQNMDKI